MIEGVIEMEEDAVADIVGVEREEVGMVRVGSVASVKHQ